LQLQYLQLGHGTLHRPASFSLQLGAKQEGCSLHCPAFGLSKNTLWRGGEEEEERREESEEMREEEGGCHARQQHIVTYIDIGLSFFSS